jgi:hypothetical protein
VKKIDLERVHPQVNPLFISKVLCFIIRGSMVKIAGEN